MAERRVEIRVLGELEVVHGARAVALPPSKKTRALLAYLVITGRPHLREHLCDFLWPGPDDPRAALRWSLTKIRGLVDVGSQARVVADRERIACEPKGAIVDLRLVQAALAGSAAQASVEALREAASRFRGELLEGLDLPDCYRYHQWCIGEREAARALRISVLGALTERLEDPVEALTYSRARVSIDPLSESAHVAVVERLVALGRKHEALDAYETCRRILADELKRAPSAALLVARAQIGQSAPTEAQAPGKTPPPPPRATTTPPAAPSIVGRDKELTAIEGFVASAAEAGAPRVLLIVGEPGIGKSTLLEELARRVRVKGGRVISGRAFEAEMIRPYGAWVDALRSSSLSDVPADARADLAALLPELGAPAATPDKTRLYDAVAHHLAEAARSSPPLAVVLDDVQWFDEASAALLHYVARALGEAPVLFACGARPEELTDNASTQRALRTLQREGRVVEIALGALEAESIAALARGIDARVDPARVAESSGGNPLFAIEIARALARGDAPFSDSLKELITDRLAHLEASARDLVPWAAALGRAFDLETLERATRMAPAQLVGAVEELERRGIVRARSTHAGTGYDFAHDLVRAGAYRTLSEPRRRMVHLQIARAIDAGGDAALSGDVAHHAALGGESALAARSYLTAAERCLRVFANVEAARLAESGLQHAGALGRDARVCARLALLHVHVYSCTWLGRARELEDQISRATLDAQDAGLAAEVAKGFHLLSVLQHDRGDLQGAKDNTMRAVDAGLEADPLTAASQLARSARCLALLERDMDRAHAMFVQAIAAAERQPGVDVLAIEWAGGLMCSFTGEYARAHVHFDRALGAARRAEERWTECELLGRMILLDLEEGNHAIAIGRCAELAPVAARMGEGSEVPVAEALASLAQVAAGDPRAHDRLERAIECLRAADAKGMFAVVSVNAADLDLERGRPTVARARAEQALVAAEVVERRSVAALARTVLARVAMSAGDAHAARRHLEATFPDVARPFGLSARARAAVLRSARALDLPLPTVLPTQETTDAP